MVLIAVHGSAVRLLPAERGTVRASIGWEAETRDEALRTVGAEHERLIADAKSFVHRGAATRWTSDQVRVRPERRYLKDSETYRIVQVANAEVTVRFCDFEALSGWAEHAGSSSGTTIGGIGWELTTARRAEAEREVRAEAVRDATERARGYADAIGAADVRLRSMWEPGLRPHVHDGDEGGMMLRSVAMPGMAEAEGVELRPGWIAVEASITADFEVA